MLVYEDHYQGAEVVLATDVTTFYQIAPKYIIITTLLVTVFET